MQFAPGHACYDPHFWLNHSMPYEVQYRNPCEPYTVALRDALPAFDRRFRGRLRDKVCLPAALPAATATAPPAAPPCSHAPAAAWPGRAVRWSVVQVLSVSAYLLSTIVVHFG